MTSGSHFTVVMAHGQPVVFPTMRLRCVVLRAKRINTLHVDVGTMINWNFGKSLTNKSRKFHSTGWHIRAKNCPLVLLNDVVNLIYERCAAAVQRRGKTKSGAGFKWRAEIHAKQKPFLTSSISILANCRSPISAIVCIGKNMACWAEKHTVSMTFRISDSFN